MPSLVTPVDSTINPMPPPRKKFGSPFSWLSRNPSGGDKKLKSPSAAQRKSTSGSLPSFGSDSIDRRIEEEDGVSFADDGTGYKNTLKDRFNLLRLREETGSPGNDAAQAAPINASERSRASSVFSGSAADQAVAAAVQRRVSQTLSTTHPPNVNENLAPGTAAGTSTGPVCEDGIHVNWDLWQAVVYEGPTAVSRTSPDQLERSIAHGIPSAIRGVVWQVLAQSKSEELENVYRDLVSRGNEPEKTTKDALRKVSASSPGPPIPGGNSDDAEKMISSASTFGSVASRPTSFNGHGNESATSIQIPTSVSDSRTAAVQHHQRTAQDEATALVKLERAIKRDLGARTSFSKFLMSAGLQTGLFGICKAYALFDEEVGYAQGMNFIAMPLLFNASITNPCQETHSGLYSIPDARRRGFLPLRTIDESLSTTRLVCQGYAWFTSTPLPVRAASRGSRASPVLSPSSPWCQSSTLCHTMVPDSFWLPLPLAACATNLRSYLESRPGNRHP